jgi:thiosulfate/3-mercaptopyruvate sulfurtransferase
MIRQADAADGSGPPVRLVDVRWYLDGSDGHEAYLGGHLPGAVFIDLDTVVAGPPSPVAGRHPLPDPGVFTAGLAAAGIGDDDLVVAYDDQSGLSASRLVWALRVLGRPASLLDGGLAGWGGDREQGGVDPTPDERVVRPWPTDAMATADEVAAHLAAGGVVVDSRAAGRYRGEAEPVDPRAGHIPGAVNAPFTDNLGTDGHFRPPADLARRFSALGIDEEAVFYCGSGVSACLNLLAMEASGHGLPRLYVGSWSQWSSDPERPAATGEEPGGPAGAGIPTGVGTGAEPASDPTLVFHLALPTDWEAARSTACYGISTRGATVNDTGFVHCSHPHQLETVANTVFHDLAELEVLHIDPARTGAELREEPVAPGSDELFPHLYGPVPIDAVVAATRWVRDSGGTWHRPPVI